MIRGTTATFKFQVPYKFDDIEFVKIVFWQDGNQGSPEHGPLPITKCKGDCCWIEEGQEISITLQPSETARFIEYRKAYVQLSATLKESGIRFACKQQEITVYPIYDDSPLGDIVPPSETDGLIIFDGGKIV